jgi:GalNAc-alpha-(1->4)-GalNAc-alpha-(1->3)-diNAcBac-PP-undecaprenol alpha-1,4-N-acetyl-D-galactosaminyltransferase
MKVFLLIDNLNSGGAQRQIVNLAHGLKMRNVHVVLATYAHGDHFQNEVLSYGIPILNCVKSSRILTFWQVLKTIRNESPNVVCAYLFTPTLLALVSRLFFFKPRTFVSERFIEHLITDWSKPLCRLLYPLAAGIIVNSQTQTDIVRSKKPLLKRKIFYVPNSVDTDTFKPGVASRVDQSTINIAGVGRITSYKNLKVIIDAITIIRAEGIPVRFRWVGRAYERMAKENEYYLECIKKIKDNNLEEIWSWEGSRLDLPDIYRSVDLLVHASYGEGFPNVICEALSSGVPVIASNVIDHPYIIKNGYNGFLFDHTSGVDLAEKIIHFWKLSNDEKLNLKAKSRETAIVSFSKEKMINTYLRLFQSDTILESILHDEGPNHHFDNE